MNNFIKTALIISITLFAANANAGVRFLVDSSTHTHRDAFKGDTGMKIKKTCNSRGYTKTNCNSNEVALEFCPQNSSYFRYCCPEDFSSTKEECYNAGMEPSSKSCHGYYRCETPEEMSEKENYRDDYNEGYPENGYYREEDTNRREHEYPIIRTQQLR